MAITRLIPNGSLGRSFARDWGVQWDAGSHTVRYAVAMFVGSGANTSPHGVGPLVTGRLTWTLGRGGPHPSPLPGGEGRVRARLGAAASWRRAHELDFRTQLGASAPDAYQHFDGTDLRWEVDLEASAGRATWRAEHLWGAYDPADPTVPNLRADGFYLQLSYAWDPHWEAVLKYEGFDPGAQLVGGHGLRWTTIGLTRWLGARRDRLQLNYVLKHEQTEPVPNDTLLIQYQHFF